MKILILNGSPRCQGLISRMLDIMAEEARIRGAEVVHSFLMHVSNLRIIHNHN